VPVLGVGVRLEAVAADVEPDGRVEGDLLVDEQVGELGEEGVGVVLRGKVAVADAPVADGLGYARDEVADALFAGGGADLAVEVLAGDDVGRGDGPVGGDFDGLLLEDELALPVLDDGVAELPGDLVEGVDAGGGEVAREGQTGVGAGGRGGVGGDLLGGGGCDFGVFGHGGTSRGAGKWRCGR
jgi:hypothetical protein